MKNLYSISGLLPAQFRDDPASAGIGWTTINPKQRPFTEIDVALETDLTAIPTCANEASDGAYANEAIWHNHYALAKLKMDRRRDAAIVPTNVKRFNDLRWAINHHR